jgi:RNA-binding protein
MLTSKQRSFLRGLANEMEPILIIGKAGINENAVIQLDQALTARELVKGRVLPHTEYEVDEVARELAAQTNSDIVQVIGRNMIFYRPPQNGAPGKINWSKED